jgi:beta-N-acetylhexosaminidase
MRIDSDLCPAIFGLSGTALTARERDFFRRVRPFGFILFARNIDTPAQVRTLTDTLRPLAGASPCPILIDQEGGRVARLRPPHWQAYPAGEAFGRLYASDAQAGRRAIYLNYRLIAADLDDLGINVDCLPVLDVPARRGHDIIGDRAYGRDPETVLDLGKEASAGLLDGGVLPVIKHIPGHGRAEVDSHLALPRVKTRASTLRRTDFPPFRGMRDAPFAMTAHVVYEDLDPDRPATTSPTVIENYIRRGIGFSGALMTDDLNMQALSGGLTDRARDAQQAGCDLALHCNGDFDDMEAVAAGLEPPSEETLQRLSAALKWLAPPKALDREAALAERDQLLSRLASR